MANATATEGATKQERIDFLKQAMAFTEGNVRAYDIKAQISLAAFVHVWGGGGVYIGNRVMIGAHTAIASRTHDYGQDIMYYTVVRKPVTIEDDVWIGSNCVILPGIHIGEGAVVGAGSVVTRDIDAKTVVAGVPARVVARRRERAVQGSEATRGD